MNKYPELPICGQIPVEMKNIEIGSLSRVEMYAGDQLVSFRIGKSWVMKKDSNLEYFDSGILEDQSFSKYSFHDYFVTKNYLLIYTLFQIVMRNRQNNFNYGQRCRPVSLDDYSVDNVSVFNSVRRKAAVRGSKMSYGNPAFEDPVSHPHV